MEVLRASAGLRVAGRRRRRDSCRARYRRRRRRHPVRGAARRARDAGDAVPDVVPEGQGARPGLRADHRRAVLRRDLGAVDRAHLPRGGRRRRAGAGAGRRHDRHRHPAPGAAARRARRGPGRTAGRRCSARSALTARRRGSGRSARRCRCTRPWRRRPRPARRGTSRRWREARHVEHAGLARPAADLSEEDARADLSGQRALDAGLARCRSPAGGRLLRGLCRRRSSPSCPAKRPLGQFTERWRDAD